VLTVKIHPKAVKTVGVAEATLGNSDKNLSPKAQLEIVDPNLALLSEEKPTAPMAAATAAAHSAPAINCNASASGSTSAGVTGKPQYIFSPVMPQHNDSDSSDCCDMCGKASKAKCSLCKSGASCQYAMNQQKQHSAKR
jgi:hypothetical protein